MTPDRKSARIVADYKAGTWTLNQAVALLAMEGVLDPVALLHGARSPVCISRSPLLRPIHIGGE